MKVPFFEPLYLLSSAFCAMVLFLYLYIKRGDNFCNRNTSHNLIVV